MPHCDATSATSDRATAAPTTRDELLRRAFSGFAFGLFSALAGLLVVCACVAEALR